MMAELQCSRTMATVVAGVVGNRHSSGRGEQQGEQSGARGWRLLRGTGGERGLTVAATRG
jgi:hypothetical protein